MAIIAAAALAVTLSACAPEEDNGAGASGTDGQNDPSESPGDDKTDAIPEDDTLAGLDQQGILTIGLEGEAAITCQYTFDSEELATAKSLAMGDWVTPEAIVHIDAPTLHWEIPQANNRLSHVLLYDQKTYAWKVPGDAKGVLADTNAEDHVEAIAARLRKNSHDCVAFAGPRSIFEVPSDMEFQRFEDLLN